MATSRERTNGREQQQDRHYQRHAGGLSVYDHASIERQGLGRHAHEQIQVSIPLYQHKSSGGIACGHVDVIPGFEEHAMDCERHPKRTRRSLLRVLKRKSHFRWRAYAKVTHVTGV